MPIFWTLKLNSYIKSTRLYIQYIRFMIETLALPWFRPTIQYTDNPNLTIYSITLKRIIASPVNGVYNSSQIHQQYIEWTSQDITISTPKAPLTNSSGSQDN
jgi:hypothetical protein